MKGGGLNVWKGCGRNLSLDFISIGRGVISYEYLEKEGEER